MMGATTVPLGYRAKLVVVMVCRYRSWVRLLVAFFWKFAWLPSGTMKASTQGRDSWADTGTSGP